MSGKRHILLNDQVFDDLNEASAYWIGFLMGDGNIHIQQKVNRLGILYSLTPVITLCLCKKDYTHLIKYTDFLCSDESIIHWNFNHGHIAYRVSFSSKLIAEKLKEFGVVPRKSAIRIVPEQLHQEPLLQHFLRGLFDADGCISYYQQKRGKSPGVRCSLVSSHLVIKFVQNYLASTLFNGRLSGHIAVLNIVSSLSYNGANHTRKILHYLYDGATIYLDRKFELYQRATASNTP